MAIDSAQERPGVGQWESGDEIDLTHYIRVLWSRWPEIILIVLVVVLLVATAVGVYKWFTPPIYESTATAVIVRTSTDVRFDDRFTTTSEAENPDLNSRRAALVALVSSGAIAQQVIAELGDALPATLQNPTDLLDVIQGELATTDGRAGQSDLINITARTDSPALSATIANAWAKAYVQQVNSVYGQVPNEMLGTIAAQLAAAQQDFAQAQAQLETHLADSPWQELERQFAVNAQLLDALQAAQVSALTNDTSHTRAQLFMYSDQWLRTNNLLTTARTLAQQAEGADADLTGVALALHVLQVQMVNGAAVSPPRGADAGVISPTQQTAQQTTLQLQLDSTAIAPADLRAEIAAVVSSLEAQLVALEEDISQVQQTLSAQPAAESAPALPTTSLGGAIAQLEEQQRLLQSQIEVERARTQEYIRQRDLALGSMEALSNKQAELQLARAAANSEVRLSSPAVPLDRPVEGVSLALSLALAATAGLLLGILVALLLEIAGIRPLRRQPFTA